MCAIVDANAAGKPFRKDSHYEGHAAKILEAVDSRGLKVVAGGKLLKELCQHSGFKLWWREAVRSGSARRVPKNAIEKERRKIEQNGGCGSNDVHVVALARVSGARLLITDDRKLQKDFGSHALVSRPRGKVYNMRGDNNRQFGETHRKLLARTDLCKVDEKKIAIHSF